MAHILGEVANLAGILHEDQSKGAAVHTFDPNASPAEKAAAAGKARDQIKPVHSKENGAGPLADGGKEVAVDTGHSDVIPTITISDADKAAVEEEHDPLAAPQPPGGMPAGPAGPIPDWYKVGWRAVGGLDAPAIEGQDKEKLLLEEFLSEQYYGQWYHNAAIVVFAVFASHFLTRFGFGWGWLFIVLGVCSTYYEHSLIRVRRNARDDIQRELVKTGLASESESAEWMNNFLDRFWLIYEPVLSATIVSSVDQILSASTPAFLDSLRLSSFTLGTKAPRIDRVRTFPKTEDDIVMMDWGLSFTPNDTSDMTSREITRKVNPKIVLAVKVGKGIATGTMPILLEDISFTGLIRVRMKLMTSFPHVQLVDISFMEKPVFDYVLKPVGGDTFGFDIGNVPGLSAFIRDMVHATLGPMMYSPNVFTLNLEQMLSGTPLDAAIGVLQVTVQSARSISVTTIGGGSPDAYVTLSINDRSTLAKTRFKRNTHNPTWMETKFILLNSLHEHLVLSVFDYNEHLKDTMLGSATFDMALLEQDATHEGIVSPILRDGKEKGTLRYDVTYYPVLKPHMVDGKEELPETKVGIVRLTIHQAKDLDASKSLSGDLNPFSKVILGKNVIHKTPIFKHTLSPVWESSTEFLCTDKASSVITIQTIDDRDFLKDPVVGYLSVQLTDLLDPKQREAGRDWWPLSGCKSGKVRISAEWKPLALAGSLSGADAYTPPIGVVRLWLDKARDVKNVEAALGGKSDPYMRVQVNNITKGRTEVINNNLNPVWDQIIYIPVHSLKESLVLECMDYQHLTKDRSLGYVELRLDELAKHTPEDAKYPYAPLGKKETVDPIRLDKGNAYKGELHYTAEFIPAVALRGLRFDSGPNEIEGAAGGSEGSDSEGGVVRGDNESVASVPHHVTAQRPVGADEAATATTTTESSKAPTEGSPTPPNGAAGSEEEEESGISMSRDELLREQSGIVIFNVRSGQLAKKARLEVLLDDGYWPAFSTVRARSTKAQWDHVGEGFIKELDFGRVWLRLNESDEGDKDDVIAEWKGDAKAFLEETMKGPATYTLTHEESEKPHSTIEIETRYVPVPVTLEPRESINNQGVLRVDLIEGSDITGVDRGGKSDPFAVFTLNGQRVFKSQTKKKTLNPDWNEDFVVSVPSRVGAAFSVEVFDWNQLEQAKSLGSGHINLADLEPFQASELVVPLSSEKHGQKGQVRIRLLFQPEIIARHRTKTSTFSAAGRAMTQVGGLPLTATKGVVHEVTGLFGGIKKDFARIGTLHSGGGNSATPTVVAPSASTSSSAAAAAAAQEIPSGQSSHPVDDPTHRAAVPTGGVPANGNGTVMTSTGSNGSANGLSAPTETLPPRPGTLRVTIFSGRDISHEEVKPYVVVRLGEREQKTKHLSKTMTPEWNESVNFIASAGTPRLHLIVHDHKTIGKDKTLGEANVDIWRHIKHSETSSADVTVELSPGSGQINLRLEFDADGAPPSPRASMSALSVKRSDTMGSPSKFSLRAGRKSGVDDS